MNCPICAKGGDCALTWIRRDPRAGQLRGWMRDDGLDDPISDNEIIRWLVDRVYTVDQNRRVGWAKYYALAEAGDRHGRHQARA